MRSVDITPVSGSSEKRSEVRTGILGHKERGDVSTRLIQGLLYFCLQSDFLTSLLVFFRVTLFLVVSSLVCQSNDLHSEWLYYSYMVIVLVKLRNILKA